jgi:hypothetical protein
MSEVVYEVLTEFVFDTRGAIENSEMLKGAVDKISSAADGAMFSLNRVAEFASHGLGLNLSVMGMLGGAISSFEKFSKTRLTFANIIASNMENLTGNVVTFNDQLAVSQRIMKDIAKVAREYSLDESSMVSTTKMLSALLTPMGLSGKNMGNAVNLARMFEKSAPVLGIDTGQAQGELVRLISGQASMGDTLFRRLVSDTAPFSKYRSMMQNPMMMHHMGGGPAQMFNMMPMEKRFDMINRALNQFSSNADVVAGNANLLANKFMALKNELIGIDGILIPIGDVLSNQIKPVLTKVMEFLEHYVRPAMERFGGALKRAFENPERIYATIRQLQQMRGDLHQAIHLQHLLGEAMFALWLLRLPPVMTLVRTLGGAFMTMTGLGLRASKFLAGFLDMSLFARGLTVVRFLLGGVGFVLQRFILPLAAFFAILQLFSRAKGYAEALDAKTMLAQAPKIGKTLAELGAAFKRVAYPFEYLFDKAARVIAPLFQYSYYILLLSDNLGRLRSPLETVGIASENAVASLLALGSALGVTFQDVGIVVSAAFGPMFTAIKETFIGVGKVIIYAFSPMVHAVLLVVKSIFTGIVDIIIAAFGPMGVAIKALLDKSAGPGGMAGALSAQLPGLQNPVTAFEKTYADVLADLRKSFKNKKDEDKNISNNNVNIGSVNIHKDFKENQEPDRIAHSLVQTLKGIAINPTQAAKRSYSGMLTQGS